MGSLWSGHQCTLHCMFRFNVNVQHLNRHIFVTSPRRSATSSIQFETLSLNIQPRTLSGIRQLIAQWFERWTLSMLALVTPSWAVNTLYSVVLELVAALSMLTQVPQVPHLPTVTQWSDYGCTVRQWNPHREHKWIANCSPTHLLLGDSSSGRLSSQLGNLVTIYNDTIDDGFGDDDFDGDDDGFDDDDMWILHDFTFPPWAARGGDKPVSHSLDYHIIAGNITKIIIIIIIIITRP